MFTGIEDHAISFRDAGELTHNFRENHPNASVKGGYFSKKAISALLSQNNAVGIRIYFGNDENEQVKLVVVGVDANENDLVGEENLCMEYSVPCPSKCGNENILNSDL